MTTLTSYGQIPIGRQAELIRKMADRGEEEHGSPEWLRQFLDLDHKGRGLRDVDISQSLLF